VKGLAFWKRVVGNIIALLSGTALARGFSAVTSVVIARQIGPEGFGQYSASIALVGLTTVLFSVGLDGWLLYHGGRNQDDLKRGFNSAFSIKIVLGIIWLTGLWMFSPLLTQSSFPRDLILLGSLSLLLEEIVRTIWSAFKACLRNDLTFILMAGFQVLFLGSTLWLAKHHIQEPASYLKGRLLAACLGAAVSLLSAHRKLGLHPQLKALWPTLLGSFPFAISIALARIYGQVDLTIVASELGKAAAGIYSPALNLTSAIFLIPAAIYGVMVPILSRGYTEDPAWTRRVSIGMTLGMAMLGLVLGCGLVFLAHPLIHLLYGTSFEASADVLAILAGVLILRCPNMALAAALVAVGWQIPRVGAQALSATLNILLNLMLVHELGVTGVAMVYVLTEAILFTGYLGIFLWWMWKRTTNLEKFC